MDKQTKAESRDLHLCLLDNKVWHSPHSSRNVGYVLQVEEAAFRDQKLHVQGYCFDRDLRPITPSALARMADEMGPRLLDEVDGSFVSAEGFDTIGCFQSGTPLPDDF